MNQRWLAIVEVVTLSFVSVLSLLFAMGWPSSGKVATSLVFAASGEAPIVTAITPNSGSNDLDTPIVITGTGFASVLSDTLVYTLPTVSLNSTPLAEVGWMSSTLLTAIVPWGLDPGVYTITVTNPDGQFVRMVNAFSVTQGIGVWTTDGPNGGAITTLLMNPAITTTIYATVQAPASSSGIGLFRSVDSGTSWDLIVAGIGNQFHAADLSLPAPTVIYVHKVGEGLYRSDNGGDNWITLPFPEPYCSELRPFASPVDSQTVYVTADCVQSGGLYKSENRGGSWITVSEGLTDTHVTALAFDPVNPQIMVVGTRSGNVFRSINGGANWTLIGKPDQVVSSLAVNHFGMHEPWATGADSSGNWGYLWKYVGDDWVQVLPGVGGENQATSIIFSREISGTMWIGTLKGGLKSVDGGNTWEPLGGSSLHVNTLVVDPTDSQVVYLGYNGTGIAKTVDSGASWAEINQGLAGVYPTGLAIHPNDPATVYATAHGVGTFKTNNGGRSWLRLPSNDLLPRAPTVDPINPRRVYIGTSDGINITENDGLTWNRVVLAPPSSYAHCCRVELNTLLTLNQSGHLVLGVGFIENNATSFEFVGGGIYISTDYGESWRFVDVGQAISPVAVLTSDPHDPETIYAGTGNCCDEKGTGVWKSEDGGETWSASGLSGQRITGIVVDPFNSQIVYATSFQGVYVSVDGGANWTRRATPEFSLGRLLIIPTTPHVIYQYGWRGLIRSVDGGFHWERAAGSLGYANIGSMAMATVEGRVVMYVGTGGGTVTGMGQGVRGFSSINDTLVNAGVYRNTLRLLNPNLYLPLVWK